jgi:hypothetical protein
MISQAIDVKTLIRQYITRFLSRYEDCENYRPMAYLPNFVCWLPRHRTFAYRVPVATFWLCLIQVGTISYFSRYNGTRQSDTFSPVSSCSNHTCPVPHASWNLSLPLLNSQALGPHLSVYSLPRQILQLYFMNNYGYSICTHYLLGLYMYTYIALYTK